MSLQCREQEVAQGTVEHLAQVQKMASIAPPLSTDATQSHQICQAGFAPGEAMLVATSHLLISHVPWQSLQEDLLHCLDGH